ncbi:PLDc N-terminal domain-containing protein [Paenibacillus pinihumi]|uniref:PLDc N-terminal domain-containing protein n=1 Tax=Paenibacillus pinihumi TaxID=669462 RepID=UPI0003FA4680|nr:PLDc N-terminal domain-containing protein [Paenibacillus pinihumi]
MGFTWGIPSLFLLLFVFIPFVLHIAICVWTYRDALRNGRSSEFAFLALLAVMFFPVFGFIVYLIIRNSRPYNGYR